MGNSPSRYDPAYSAFVRMIIEIIEQKISSKVHEYEFHLRNLKTMQPKILFGMDQSRDIHPLLFACRELNIPTMAFQTTNYDGDPIYSPCMLTREEFQWYEKLIVWGEYWKEMLLKNSGVYREDTFLIGSNKLSYGYTRIQSPKFDPKNVLIPSEYYVNTYKVGRFMERLMDLGYTVYFKVRPGGSPEKELQSYYVAKEYSDRVKIVEHITDEIMGEINIVAGSGSAMLYDLLPYGKETWIFATEYTLLNEMAENGYATLVRYEDLDTIQPPARADNRFDYTHIYNDQPLKKVLEQHVYSRL